MAMYAGMCYQACINGVYALMQYEEDVSKVIMDKLPVDTTKDITNIIIGYYNTKEEYDYGVGIKNPKD